jgi:hypothetical protein
VDTGSVTNILVGSVVVIAVIAIAYIADRRSSQRIRDYLSDRGATDVEIRRLWFTGGTDNAVYEVEYTDRAGRSRGTRCLIRSSILGKELYWTDPP